MSAQPERRRVVGQADADPLQLLVIDDDANYRGWLVVLGQRLGFQVDDAVEGEAGLAMLAAAPYDVVIVDHEMPRVTGIDVVHALRRDPATQAIYALMLTAHDEMTMKLTALDAGFDDFISKSSTEAELVAKLMAARRIAARQRTLDVAVRELYGLATRDGLTGLFNRRFFVTEAERLLAAGSVVNLILFDLDAFKQVNDTHGHLTGDSVLRAVGALFRRRTRPDDVVARFGGDEFVMIIPGADVLSIERIATRLSREVEALRWKADGKTFGIGVSTGVASSRFLVEPALAPLLEAADRDMYKNKFLRRRGERKTVWPQQPEARL